MSPTATTTRIVLERRFNGPAATANGGYACGVVARHVDGPAHVSLRRPVPLGTPLALERHDDGHVVFGPLASHPGLTGAVLLAGPDVPQQDGAVAPEIAWAALDCPSYTPPLWGDGTPSLLAGMRAELLEPVPAGEPAAVVGWSLGTDGRKHRSATAILAADGRVLALAQALWIRLRG